MVFYFIIFYLLYMYVEVVEILQYKNLFGLTSFKIKNRCDWEKLTYLE